MPIRQPAIWQTDDGQEQSSSTDHNELNEYVYSTSKSVVISVTQGLASTRLQNLSWTNVNQYWNYTELSSDKRALKKS